MNGYLSQIAVRAGGAIMPHSLTPVRPLGMFIPRLTDTGSDMTRPLPPPPLAASPVKQDSVERLLPKQPQPARQQMPGEVPEQLQKVPNRILYLERFLERSLADVQTSSADRVITSKPAAPNNMPAVTGETAGNTSRVNDTIQPAARPQQEPDNKPPQIFVARPDAPEKAVVYSLQPVTKQKDAAVAIQQPSPLKASQQNMTVLTPRDNAKALVPQAKKTTPPRITIGRITVEVVPPPAVPVQTVQRNRQRSTGSPIPAPGSDEIHKLSFGFGQL